MEKIDRNYELERGEVFFKKVLDKFDEIVDWINKFEAPLILVEGEPPSERRVVPLEQVDFDPKVQVADFIEIVPCGMFSAYRGKVFSGDWIADNIKTVTDRLEAEYKEFVPEQYQSRVKTIIHPPVDDGDPATRTGTIAWKYMPIK